MAYTTPKTWATNDLLTATDMNTYIRDNVAWLATDKPRVRAKRTSNQSIANNTFVAISFDAEDWDTQSMHSNVTNPSRLTVPTGGGGKYTIGFYIYWQPNATGRRVIRFIKNGVTLLGDIEMIKESTGLCSGAATLEDSAVAADYWEVQAFQVSGGALNVEAVSIPTLFWATWNGT
jgi:hypothetical protein